MQPPVTTPIETIDLVRLDEMEVAQAAPLTLGERLRVWMRRERWFVAMVLVPTALACLYYGLLAADRYQSEARFVVRQPNSPLSAAALGGLMQSSAIGRSNDDTYIVHAYLKSRDAVQNLVRNSALLERVGRSKGDVLWRYPSLLSKHTDERLWEYFQNLFKIDFDSSTGISTLKVQGFEPDDARALTEAMLDDAEKLVNRLSDRAQSDRVKMAEGEVALARKKAEASLNTLKEWRTENQLIDPALSSKAALETITRLALDIAQTNAQIAQMRAASPDSPQVAALQARVTAFEDQLQKERQSLAGNDQSLAPKMAEYERLILEREFAERTFASTQAAYDLARIEAERQRLFLERISVPTASDYATYPNRLMNIAIVFILAWMVYALLRRFVDDTNAHGEL